MHTTTTSPSQSHVVPSKATVRSLWAISCFRRSTSSASINEIMLNKCHLSIKRYPDSSSKPLKQSILLRGTPAQRKQEDTLIQYTYTFLGNVSTQLWFFSLYHTTASAISCFQHSLACNFIFPCSCFFRSYMITNSYILLRFNSSLRSKIAYG